MKKGLFFLVLVFLFPLGLQAKPISWNQFLSQKMTWDDARHLLGRAGFGATAREIQQFTGISYKEAIQKLLAEMQTSPTTPPPNWVREIPFNPKKVRAFLKSLPRPERQEFQRMIRQFEQRRQWELKGWWFGEMIRTKSPLTEKMTLFFHNHFTSSLRKCRSPQLMYKQIQLYRRYSKGNFKALVKLVTRDPAMVIYLDNQTNRKGRPNENFARELMELFTLGEGHYTEGDIVESARAFTGYSANRMTNGFQFRPRLHDFGLKTFMGQKGYFDGDDIVDIIFQKKQVALYLTTRLWKEFISPNPDPEEVERLADIFRTNHYELQPLLKAIFTSPSFWNRKNRGSLIKSPVELIVGTSRLLGVAVKNLSLLARASAQLGQNLLDPPNVKGWEGGNRWISTNTLLLRRQMILQVLRGAQLLGKKGKNDPRKKKLNKNQQKKMQRTMARQKEAQKRMREKMIESFQLEKLATPAEKIQRLQKILLPLHPTLPLGDKKSLREALSHYLLDITYQLK